MTRPPICQMAAFAALAGCATLAHAHAGHGDGSGFVAGFMHPMLGVDHLLGALAVGLWVAWARARARAALFAPIGFLGAMVSGAAIGCAGLASSGLETLIALTVVASGLILAGPGTARTSMVAVLLAVFGAGHGIAHGLEIPAQAAYAPYAAGLFAATGALLATGVVLGRVLLGTREAVRLAGWPIALAGGCLLAAAT